MRPARFAPSRGCFHVGWVLSLSFCAAALITGGSAAAGSGPRSGFPSRSGRVTYQVKGTLMNGTSVVSWIEGGKRVRSDVQATVTFGQQSMPVNSWTLTYGGYLYTHQPMFGKLVYRTKLPKTDGKGVAGGLGAGGQPLIALGKGAGRVIKKENVLGKPCIVRQIGAARIWFWEGLPLKSQTEQGQAGTITLTATKLDTSARPAASTFRIPAGYQVKDMPAGMLGKPGAGRPGAPGPGAH